MKSLLSVVPGGPESLEIQDIATPTTKKGELGISVHAVGMNFPDLLIIEDKYQIRPPRPFSPGAELSGVVNTVGPGIKDFAPGDRVMAFILSGALSEQVCVDARLCRKIPDIVTHVQAAALQMAYGTAFYGLTVRGNLGKNERLLVLGAAGGVGLAAVELGRVLQAKVTAVVSTHEKGETAVAYGAESYVICPRGQLERPAQRALSQSFKDALPGMSADVVFDTVGGDLSEPALRVLDWMGRFLVVGFPAGIPNIPANLPLLKSCDVRGVFWGEAVKRDMSAHQRAMDGLLNLCAEGQIRPRIHATYSLDEFQAAFEALKDGKPIGKIVVTIKSAF